MRGLIAVFHAPGLACKRFCDFGAVFESMVFGCKVSDALEAVFALRCVVIVIDSGRGTRSWHVRAYWRSPLPQRSGKTSSGESNV